MEAEEFRAVLGAVRDLVRKDVVPREDEIEGRDEIPADLRRQAADMGLFGYGIEGPFRIYEGTSEVQNRFRRGCRRIGHERHRRARQSLRSAR
ncbi:acyl-CoA dehydrogenase family protein [Amycolatopsis pigmentata]|uniref:Acyl-CoA dehydrogenase family protein n=1 Tax=Amycolatopsis pigmentata TaxID=450801 RepID=A0ABW5FXU0_9PSEU